MLLWPFSTARFVASWAFLPAAPIGFRFVSRSGAAVLLREAILFSPLLLYSVWPRAGARVAASHPGGR